jgi:hypothetical protein
LTWEVKVELVVGVEDEDEDEEGAASKSSRIIITVIVKQGEAEQPRCLSVYLLGKAEI